MSVPNYSIQDQVKKRGIIPFVDGDYVLSQASDNNTGTTVYTVPASQLFKITSCTLKISAIQTGSVFLYVNDSGGSFYIDLLCMSIVSGSPFTCPSRDMFYPIEIPAGYKIILYTNAAGLTAVATVAGWSG